MKFKTTAALGPKGEVMLQLKSQADSRLLEELVCRSPDPAMLLEYISDGLDPDTTIDGETLLMCAVQNGHASIVKVLLDAGADPNLTFLKSKVTPLMAAASGRVNIFQKLLEAGADPNCVDAKGCSVDLYAGITKPFNGKVLTMSDRRAQLLEIFRREYSIKIVAQAEAATPSAARKSVRF